MSTPSRENVQTKFAVGKALDLLARWCEDSLQTFETVLKVLPESEQFEAGQICLLRDMLVPIRENARALATLKLNVARTEAGERLADAELEATEAVRQRTIPEEDRRLFEDAYLAGKRVNAYDMAETRRTLEHERATEELMQEAPVERKLAERERLVETERRKCPDDGTCHHSCDTACWRVFNAEPLSAAGWGDSWPDEVRCQELARLARQVDPAELEAAEEDAKLYGAGYIVDGYRVAPQVVRVIVRRDGEVVELET